MELWMHAVNKTVEMQVGGTREGLYGILRFVIPEDGRAAFDSGLIPSIDWLRKREGGKRANTLVKTWGTAGFREDSLHGAGLVYEYDPNIYAKYNKQLTGKGPQK